MKRVLCALMLVCTAVFGFSTVWVCAAESEDMHISVSNETIYVGDDEVAVSIMVDSNPGMAGMELELGYDTSKLEYLVSEAGIFGGQLTFEAEGPGWEEGVDTFTVIWSNSGNVNKTGTLCKIRFRVKENVVAGTIPVTIHIGEILDQNFEDLNYGFTNGSVTILDLMQIEGYTLSDKHEVYDGSAKNIEVDAAADATENVTVTYKYYCGNEEIEQSDMVLPGAYTVEANLESPKHKSKVLRATLTIDPAQIEGITLPTPAPVVYDGSSHDVTVKTGENSTGNVNITYKYYNKNNVEIDETNVIVPGEYRVVAIIEKEYYVPMTLETTLTIDPAQIVGYTMPTPAPVVYDGSSHDVTVKTGENSTGDVNITYKYYNKNNVEIDETDVIIPGEYRVVAIIEKEHYVPERIETTMVINPAPIVGYKMPTPAPVVYDGSSHDVTVETGAGSTGDVNITYEYYNENNVKINKTDIVVPGEYKVVAVIEKEHYVPERIETTLTINNGKIAGYSMPTQVTAVYDGSSHDVTVETGAGSTGDVNITYEYYNENNVKINKSDIILPGTYTVVASGRKDYYDPEEWTSTLVIDKGAGENNPKYQEIFNYILRRKTTGTETLQNLGIAIANYEFLGDISLVLGENEIPVNYMPNEAENGDLYYGVENGIKKLVLTSKYFDRAHDTVEYAVVGNNSKIQSMSSELKHYMNDNIQALPNEYNLAYRFKDKTTGEWEEVWQDGEVQAAEGGDYDVQIKVTATEDGEAVEYVPFETGFRINYKVGDVNTDGKANLADAIKMLQHIAKWKNIGFTPTQMKAGGHIQKTNGVYEDDKIRLNDVILLLQKIAKWKNIEFGPAN